MRLLVRSLGCCVLATCAWAQTNVIIAYPPTPPASTVIVGAPVYSAPRELEPEAPISKTTYLIAFKDGEIRAVDQYWVKDGMLYYLTEDHQKGMASIARVDRSLSQQLNSERNVAFNLPLQARSATARTHLVRHVSFVRKRCCCVRTLSARSTSVKGGASRAIRRRE
jgi:hypothetical protein